MLLLLIVPAALAYLAFKIMREMNEDTRQLLESLADAVDLRDSYTGGHSRRVTEYTGDILSRLGMKGPEVALILAAARAHDIGKIGMPDAILHKPDRLTDEELEIMELHPVHGANLLRRYGDFARGVDIVLHHHERMDGLGYPSHLRGTEIPFGARVIAVADSFDAMTSDRPYRRGMPVAKAMEILSGGRGTQWDSAIVDAMLEAIGAVAQVPSVEPTRATTVVASAAAEPALSYELALAAAPR
jgi:HD-GYP domain-containing protein (c-di-GMP phosphodiesterase class II)